MWIWFPDCCRQWISILKEQWKHKNIWFRWTDNPKTCFGAGYSLPFIGSTIGSYNNKLQLNCATQNSISPSSSSTRLSFGGPWGVETIPVYIGWDAPWDTDNHSQSLSHLRVLPAKPACMSLDFGWKLEHPQTITTSQKSRPTNFSCCDYSRHSITINGNISIFMELVWNATLRPEVQWNNVIPCLPWMWSKLTNTEKWRR